MTSAATVLGWWDHPADGPTNMAADLALVDEAGRRGGLVLRCYGWSEPTVSLGAFQPLAGAETHAGIAGLPVVRRPSGGGAIVHGTDLTYAAAVPRDHPWASPPQALYDALHAAMVDVLAEHGVVARLHVAEVAGTGDAAGEPYLCFDRRAPGDVVAARPGRPPAATDPKIMGSAQRRLAGTVLQHGSLLLRANPAVRGDAVHAGIAELGAEAAVRQPRRLAVAWLERLARRLGAEPAWEADFPSSLAAAELESGVARFRESRWLRRY